MELRMTKKASVRFSWSPYDCSMKISSELLPVGLRMDLKACVHPEPMP